MGVGRPSCSRLPDSHDSPIRKASYRGDALARRSTACRASLGASVAEETAGEAQLLTATADPTCEQGFPLWYNGGARPGEYPGTTTGTHVTKAAREDTSTFIFSRVWKDITHSKLRTGLLPKAHGVPVKSPALSESAQNETVASACPATTTHFFSRCTPQRKASNLQKRHHCTIRECCGHELLHSRVLS